MFIPIGLIAVLVIHEVGHLLSMKYFGYGDLEFYMLLPFGAVAYGEKEYSRTSESMIIYLAGPLPGILIGSILASIGTVLNLDIIIYLAIMFLFINTINLLPIFPLDGGRLLTSIFRLNKKQLLFVILVSLTLTIIAMVFFWLFDLVILIAIQVYLFITLRSEKNFMDDNLYDLNKPKVVLALLIYFVSLAVAIFSIAYCFYYF